MFCRNCGTQVDDNQKFCPNCGAALMQDQGGQNAGTQNPGGYEQVKYNIYQQPEVQSPKKKSHLPVIIVSIVVGVLVIIAAAAGIFFVLRNRSGEGSGLPFSEKKSSYTDPIDTLMEGMEKQDGDIMLSAFSDGTIEILEEQSGYSRSEIADMFEELFTGSMGMDVKAGSYQIDYEIDEETDITGSDLEDIQDEFDMQGLDEEIEEAKALELTMIVGMESITDETFEDSMELQVIKIDGKWYIDPTSM